MSNKEIDPFFNPRRTTGRGYLEDPMRPVCVNRGCNCKVRVVRYDDNGKPIYRTVCFNCHNAGREGSTAKYKEGVTPVKKDYCENYRGELFPDFPCPTTHDKTKINMEGETGVLESAMLDQDHKDGDHYNNVEGNIQTLCKGGCHVYKTNLNGDHQSRSIMGNPHIRGDKVVREDLRVKKPEYITHDFFEEE